MEKDQKILIGIIVSIFIVAIGVGIFLYLKKDNNNISDALKFKNEYESYNGKTYDGTEIEYINLEIPKDNLFKYTPEKEAVDILQVHLKNNGDKNNWFNNRMRCNWNSYIRCNSK